MKKNVFKLSALAASALLMAGVASADDRVAFADPEYLLQNHPTRISVNEKVVSFMKNNEAKFADESKKIDAEEKAFLAERSKLEADAKKLEAESKNVEASLKNKIAKLEKEAPRLRSKDIQARQNAIQAEQKAFQNKVAAIQKREEALNTKGQALEKKINDFQAKVTEAQKEAIGGLTPEELNKRIGDEINQALGQVAEAKGYTVILPVNVGLYVKDKKVDITEDVLAELKKIAEQNPLKATEAPAPKAEEPKKEEPKTENAEEAKK